MNSEVFVLGVGATPFGRHLGRTAADLAGQAAHEALSDASLSPADVGAIFHATVSQKAIDGQHMIPGQIAMRPHGFSGAPVVNVENACAGGATALWLAIAHVQAGLSEVALAVGVDKLVCADSAQGLAVFDGALDVTHREEALTALAALAGPPPPGLEAVDGDRSVFMEIYAAFARAHMQRFGTTETQLAAVAAKNHAHSVHNSRAHFRKRFTADEVLAARRVAWPLTVPMCSPVSDGAAAVVVTSADFARSRGTGRPAVAVLSSVLLSGTDRAADDADQHIGRRAAVAAYEQAGVGPGDVDVAEVHDATAFGEIQQVENLGFCPIGNGGPWSASGASTLGGALPVNPSGGLESRGHPVSATGLAQVFELVTQLRGRAGDRQVPGARIAIAENGGGLFGIEEAVAAVTILERTE
ncbi:thiolase family protein [Saccharopolyspora elongata]|uniref:Thiolase family protein n=1 Tax=Saccharopolyspora elongata TaxID=2530387 RepID=A0A4R4YCC3_9PSEU|nr:thiolase family protein [Saccharopolyspora elongata]TDD42193.1 thiolase family protein [Saccharopolyspora elongata]